MNEGWCCLVPGGVSSIWLCRALLSLSRVVLIVSRLMGELIIVDYIGYCVVQYWAQESGGGGMATQTCFIMFTLRTDIRPYMYRQPDACSHTPWFMTD